MLKRVGGYLFLRDEPVTSASANLQNEGYAQLVGVFEPDEVTALKVEIDAIYATYPPDGRAAAIRDPQEDNDFRYQMFNRSPLAQTAIAHPRILECIEPLLGEDCHVIANTCWRNPPRERNTHGGGFWHIDAGPHIPHAADVLWDDRIAFPVFVIGAHLYLQDCPMACGPTGVIPGSHKSGRPPPADRRTDEDLTWNDRGVVPLIAKAGDVALFVSDVWHRRLPSCEGDAGRYFLQAHYGRRDIAQRILPTSEVNHVGAEARSRIATERERRLLGLHPNFFYDG